MDNFGVSSETKEIMMSSDIVTCKKCFWSYFKVSKEYMVREIKSFLDFYNSQPEDVKEHYGKQTPESMLNTYTKCMICGDSHKNMREYDLKTDNNLDGQTISPMLDPNEDV